MARDLTHFDRFFEQGGYEDGEEPQAFADWLAGKTGKKVVGLSEDGAVEGHPRLTKDESGTGAGADQ
jgi:hypothetical protein